MSPQAVAAQIEPQSAVMVTLYRSLPQQTALDSQITANTMGRLFASTGLQNPAGSGSEPLQKQSRQRWRPRG
jgi:hypothetical protein